MEPEEIDNLFREKLKGFAPLPSPDAFMRLQQKMEPPKKERSLWIYYAAASISILLIAGLFIFRNGDKIGIEPGLAVTKPTNSKAVPGVLSIIASMIISLYLHILNKTIRISFYKGTTD